MIKEEKVLEQMDDKKAMIYKQKKEVGNKENKKEEESKNEISRKITYL